MRSYFKAAIAAGSLLFAGAANAATYITYTGTGHGSFITLDVKQNIIGQGGAGFTYTMTILADPSFIGCIGPMTCGVSATGVNATYSFGSSGWQTLSLGFANSGNTHYPDVSSTLTGGHAHSSLQGQNYSTTMWDGFVDTLQVSTFDAPFTSTNFGISWFGTGVPEPATWVLMLTGFAITGASLRRRTKVQFA